MNRYKRIMVGLTRTGVDAGLLRYAAMVVRLGSVAEVRFAHVLPNATDALLPHDEDRVLAELQSMVHADFVGVPETTQVSYDILPGPLVDRLLTHVAEKQVDLLLVGHRQGVPGRKALARRLAMKAPCSVWMVPEGSPAELRRILVPIDFSEPAADSMRVATSMARMSGHSECLALHVYFNEAVITYEGYDQVLRGQEEHAYRQFIGPINCQGVSVTPHFEESSKVARTIVRVAEQRAADLIVLATRGRSRSAAILLGSVTEDMIIETRVPLLAVKHFGARLGVLQALLDRRFFQRGGLHTD